MDFVQQFVMHPREDASPVMPMHVCLVGADGGQWAPSEPLADDASLADVIAAYNALVVPAKKAAEPVTEQVAEDEEPAEPVAVEEAAGPEPEAPGNRKPTMDWLKGDLIAYAADHGVAVEADDTKADILDKLGV